MVDEKRIRSSDPKRERVVMSTRRKACISIPLGLILLFGLATLAQGQPPPVHPDSHMLEKAKIRENIETLRMWRLLEILDLSSEQSTQFLPILKEFQDAKRDFRNSRRELLEELESALQSEKTDEKRLRENLAGLDDARKEFQLELEKFLNRSREILTVEQQAKLMLFEERFERRLKESIEHMRKRGPRRGGSGL